MFELESSITDSSKHGDCTGGATADSEVWLAFHRVGDNRVLREGSDGRIRFQSERSIANAKIDVDSIATATRNDEIAIFHRN